MSLPSHFLPKKCLPPHFFLRKVIASSFFVVKIISPFNSIELESLCPSSTRRKSSCHIDNASKTVIFLFTNPTRNISSSFRKNAYMSNDQASQQDVSDLSDDIFANVIGKSGENMHLFLHLVLPLFFYTEVFAPFLFSRKKYKVFPPSFR